MKKRLAIFALAATAVFTAAHADDYGVWLGASVQKNITKQFLVDAGLGMRAENKLNDLTRYDFDAGLGYKITPWLGIGGGYSFIRDYNLEEVTPKTRGVNVEEAYWRNKHRATFDVTGSWDVRLANKSCFEFSVRERYQYTHFVPTQTTKTKYRAPLSDEQLGGWAGDVYPYDGVLYSSKSQELDGKRSKHKHYLRSRFQVAYNIRHCSWTPYASYEFSNDFCNSLHLDKQRLTAGVEWKVTKQHKIDFAYVYNHGADDDSDGNNHVLSIGYKFKF